MNNYKITASVEAVSLFCDLGYDVSGLSKESEFLFAKAEDMSVYNYVLEQKGYQELTLPQLRDLVAQSKNEQGLISGADALRALADGKEVEHKANSHMPWGDASLIAAKLFSNTCYQFRLKPRTITLSLEIPAPFEPKDGDTCFIVDSEQEDGFYRFIFSSDSGSHQNLIQFGVYPTEEEIKQVVAALRGIKG